MNPPEISKNGLKSRDRSFDLGRQAAA